MMKFEDPSIDRASVCIASDAWDEIDALVGKGADFYVARERVLSTHGAAWSKKYGRETASRAIRLVEAIDPNNPGNFSPETVRARRRPPGREQIAIAVLAAAAVFALFPTSLLAWAIWAATGGPGAAAYGLLVSAVAAGYMLVRLSDPGFVG
jgi:hypothetical protein